MCIAQYDHHCPWINNCVGRSNIGRFFLFLNLVLVAMLWMCYLGTQVIVMGTKGDIICWLFRFREWETIIESQILKFVAAGLLILPILIFGVPLLFLLLVQGKNLLLNRTTY